MREVEEVLASVTPRKATIALLLFGEMAEECERRSGRHLTQTDRRFLQAVFRSVLQKECQPV